MSNPNSYTKLNETSLDSKTSFISKRVFVWEWTDIETLTEKQWGERFEKLSNLGVTDVKINCESIVTNLDLDNSSSKRREIVEMMVKVGSKAKEHGVNLWASTGTPEWALSSHAYLNKILVGVVSEAKNFDGVWLDHEFWNLDDFKNNPEEVAVDFLNELKRLTDESDVNIGIAIPAWFDGSGDVLPSLIDWNNSSKNLFSHIVDAMDSKNKIGLINLMAYSKNSNKTISLSTEESLILSEANSKLQITVGFESNQSIEDVSYYSEGILRLVEDANTVTKTMSKYPNFIGVSINDSEGLIKVSER